MQTGLDPSSFPGGDHTGPETRPIMVEREGLGGKHGCLCPVHDQKGSQLIPSQVAIIKSRITPATRSRN